MNQTKTQHEPVLLNEVMDVLKPKDTERYLDLTAGYGGHASVVLEKIGMHGRATLVDRDQNAIDFLAARFKEDKRVSIMHQAFLQASQALIAAGEQYDMILVDLGVSSPHIDKAERGFSFAKEGPLDMRMDNRQDLTASEIINTWNREDLIRIFREYGEVPRPSRIAEVIEANRPIETTTELADIIATAVPRRGKKSIHPATLVFQAIRIAVNQELEQIKQSIPLWVGLLKPGGRIAIISFHSLEDRLVKQAFKEYGGNRYDASLQILTVRPMQATATEIVFNPRARSAKLRAAAKIKI